MGGFSQQAVGPHATIRMGGGCWEGEREGWRGRERQRHTETEGGEGKTDGGGERERQR